MKTILEVVRDLIKPYIDKNASNIAPVEDSPVENPYYVGDQLIYKGVLYNVTADISIGDTLEIGTNISVAPKINSSVKSKLSSYSSDSTVWDTSPTASSTKPVTSGGVYTGLSGKAPTNHASTATTYGAGNASNYGHVKLNDSYTSSGGAASASVGASSKAVVDGYNDLNGNKTNQSVIAPRQANTTATQKYEVGKQFIYNNILYTATAEIAKNGTINPSGNCSQSEDITSQISNVKTLMPKNYGIDDIPFQRGGDVDANLAYKRVRVFDANSGALPSFATSGNNDMIVVNHWFSDGSVNFAIQIAFNIRADNIEFRRFFHNVGWYPWHTII